MSKTILINEIDKLEEQILSLGEHLTKIGFEVDQEEQKKNFAGLRAALLESYSYLEAFDIINHKNVMIHWLKVSKDVEEYNSALSRFSEELNQEEYDAVKRSLIDERVEN